MNQEQQRFPIEFCNDSQSYIFPCPHCGEFIQVLKSQTACCIFRHGVFKHNGEQIPPHSGKEMCDSLCDSGQIYGCGKPFKLILENADKYVETCGYI